MPICENRQCVAGSIQIAESFAARLVGLLGRRELGCEEGLLIKPGGSVHTLGMRFAVDVLFLDRRLRILRIVAALLPGRFAVAPRGTRSVLEIAAGRAAWLELRAGMSLVEHGGGLWTSGTGRCSEGLKG